MTDLMRMTLTDQQFEVLNDLDYLGRHPRRCRFPELKAATPKDFGGRDGTHHSTTAKRLSERGLVERIDRSRSWSRKTWAYRITSAGLAALNLAKSRRRG